MKVFEERISRLRNTPILFDSFQHRQNFLPVVDTSPNIFLLVIEGVKGNSLVNKKEQMHMLFQQIQIKILFLYILLLFSLRVPKSFSYTKQSSFVK